MAAETKIQWTDRTFNPWRGCTKVSPGCAHCYAETMSNRNPAVLGVWGPQGTRPTAAESYWRQPHAWEREAVRQNLRARVFCASLCDVFEVVPPAAAPAVADARRRLWDTIRATPHLDWQLLTKRPERITAYMPPGEWPNVWLGVSVETQEYLWRLDALHDACALCNVPVRFCSAEPLLGHVAFGSTIGPGGCNWVIVGGESGGSARPFYLWWARSIVCQCRLARVACFVKQLGAEPWGDCPSFGHPAYLPLGLVDRKGGDPAEWPADLCIREFPEPAINPN